MKHKKTAFLLSAVLAVILLSCEDFIEKDLGKKSLTVNSPADNAVSLTFNVTFWWDELKGASKYQLQVVRPSFAAMQEFVVDTSVSGDRVVLTLSPGTYQWRIRAKNSSSATEYITRILTIDSTLNLSGQPLSLFSPADDSWTNHLLTNFSWQTLPNTDYYVLQLLLNGALLHTQSYAAPVTTGSYTFPAEGTYEWRVFAQNGSSNSSYYTRTITIDTTRPAAPVLLYPLADTTNTSPVPLGWSSAETAASFHLQIATDSAFGNVVHDTTETGTTYDLYNTAAGQYYYWRVKAIDKALNQGSWLSGHRIKRN
ncbi:MAG: hypothetical protein JWO44_1640 [Bacteroidetes bacterium]|nr:hypothetical protein [Bacteroidota bacterium]